MVKLYTIRSGIKEKEREREKKERESLTKILNFFVVIPSLHTKVLNYLFVNHYKDIGKILLLILISF